MKNRNPSWTVQVVHDLKGLSQLGPAWDRLERVAADHHECSIASVSSFLHRFSCSDRFFAVTVMDGERMMAALPVVRERSLGMFPVVRNLANHWFPGRTGLLDPQYDAHQLVGHLIDGLQAEKVSALELDWTNPEAPLAKAITEAAQSESLVISTNDKFTSGYTVLVDSWDAFTADWSKSRRKFIRKAENRLAEHGPLYTVAVHHQSPDQIDDYIETCLKIENGSWKGQQQSSLLQNPAAMDHFRDLLKCWQDEGRLQLYLLKCNGRPIAFDLGYLKNRVATSLKISYLEDYTAYSPGHVLNAMVIREMIRQGGIDRIDIVGEMLEANRKWCQESYPCQKMEIGLPGWMNHSRVQIRDWMRTLKRTAKNLKTTEATETA